MAGKLSNKVIDSLTKPATVTDGGGLYLQIAPGGAKSWLYRYQLNGRRRWMGLGPYPTVSASKARADRDELRKQVKAGIDPLADREATKEASAAALKAAQREAVTFSQCAESFMNSKEAQWGNPKHRQQWRNTLTQFAYPSIGNKSVAKVETSDILQILQPIWASKTETAKRVQGRIENILDYARSVGLREGENPARWKGHLSHTLPTPSKVTKVQHQRALPYKEAPALVAALRGLDTHASRALRLTIYCATRTSETLQASWSEIDLESGLWTIPAERMKAGKPHRIPLTADAVELLRQQESLRRDDWVFPGQKLKQSLSNMAMTNVLKRIDWLDRTTVHGLRSTFRDWVADCTTFPDRLAEVALAHQLADRVQAAYNRTDMMDKRRGMMEAWAQFLEAKPGKVLTLPTGNAATMGASA